MNYLAGPYLPGPWRPNCFWPPRAGQNEAGQIKGRSKLGELKFFSQNNWTFSNVCMH